MLERANRNKEKADADNVSFIESAITQIVLPDATADCIISNCVINLVPEQEKQLAFNEMFRLLKPGGRLAISDILTRKKLAEELKKSIALYVGCISGASQVRDYEKYLSEAGFSCKNSLSACVVSHLQSRLLILLCLIRCHDCGQHA
jgi:arsenite methyltransferase